MSQFGEGGEPGKGTPEVEIKPGVPEWVEKRLNGLPVFAKLDPNEDGPPHLNPDWIIAFYLFGDNAGGMQALDEGLHGLRNRTVTHPRFDLCQSCMHILDLVRKITGSPNLELAGQWKEEDYEKMVKELKNELSMVKNNAT